MDIDLLAKLVRDVILENDEVTLPGVGSFVAETLPATFSDKGFTINPPYRRLSFRQRQGSDTFLVDLYARTCNVEPAEAKETIENFLLEMKEVLKIRKTIIFPSLGRLRATKENYFFFVCDENLDIFPQGFGLDPVSLKSRSSEGAGTYLRPLDVNADQSVQIPETSTADNEEASEPETVSDVELQPEPQVLNVVEDVAKDAEPVKKNGSAGVKVLVALMVLVVLFFAAIAVLGRVAPEFIDRFLYSAEELQILNY